MGDNEITKNLVYLTQNLTNLHEILIYLVQDQIISRNEKDEIESRRTPMERNDKLLSTIQKKDWQRVRNRFIEILRRTNNGHCADKIEWISTSTQPRNITKIKYKWWPDRKPLIKSLHKRKFGSRLLVEKLHERILADENRMVVLCESADASKLTGMGGVGKTLTAEWYAHHFEEEYDHILWIDCGEGSLLQSFKSLARDLDVKNRNELISVEEFARKSFETFWEFKCLWIYDNAESYEGKEGIINVLPKSQRNFFCLITSQSREWGVDYVGHGKITEFELDIFSEGESLEFFRGKLNEEIKCSDFELRELSHLLGNLPMALQLALVTLNGKKMTINEFIEKIREKGLRILGAIFDKYEETMNQNNGDSGAGSMTSRASSTSTTIGFLDNQSLKHFQNFEVINSGAFGSVMKAKQKETQIIFAIKITKQNFYREVDNLQKSNHPNIVKFFSSWKEHSNEEIKSLHSKFEDYKEMYCMQMELCDGRDLNSWIIKDPSEKVEWDGKRICFQISLGVESLHSKNIIHRDLKPANILLLNKYVKGQEDLVVKIGDLGMSRDTYQESKMSRRSLMTNCGTEFYMSPEQELKRERYDNKADIFPLGIIFYELLNSTFQNTKVVASIRQAVIPSTFMDKLKMETAFLKLMLSRDPLRRPKATEVVDKLNELWNIDPSRMASISNIPSTASITNVPAFSSNQVLPYEAPKSDWKDIDIIKHSVYLSEHLTNLDAILRCLFGSKIISRDQKEEIEREPSTSKQIDKLLAIIERKWATKGGEFIQILRDTLNEDCADEIEG